MQSQFSRPQRLNTRRAQQFNATPGLLVTALSIGLGLILILTIFVGDWLKSPGLQVSTSRMLFSPNNDGTFDMFDVTYSLKNSAAVTITVFSESAPVRVLQDNLAQPPGKHFITWNGRDQNGALLPDGAYRIQVSAASALRNETGVISAQIDTTPPMVQLLNSAAQMRVNTSEITLEGVTEPRAVIWWNGSLFGTVDSSGRFAVPVRLQEGPNLFSLSVVDEAGNAATLQREIILSTRGPEITLLRPTENEWTNQQVIEIQGRMTPPGELTINQQKVQTTQDGMFVYQAVLNPGANLLYIEAKDDLGNITSLSRTVYYKAGAASIQLNIEDGESVASPALQLVGRVEPGSRVSINGQVVNVGMLGDFQIELPLIEGQNIIEIQSIDQAGNISRMTRRVVYNPALGEVTSWNQINQNFMQAPWLIVPALLLTLLVLGFLYWRQNHIELTLSLSQTSFSPGSSEAANAPLEIYLDLSQTARVSLEVFDAQGYPRAILLNQRRKMGRRHIIPWNGLDNQGRPLPPGQYTVRAVAGAPPLQVTCSVPLQIERAIPTRATHSVITRQTIGSDKRY